MGRRVVLHIGAMKTGTSYVQSVLGGNKDEIAGTGVEFLGGFAAHHIGGRIVFFLFLGAQGGLFRRMFGFLRQQFLAILARNLIIVGVDFGKSQKSVAIAAIIHKSSLQRRFDAGDFC